MTPKRISLHWPAEKRQNKSSLIRLNGHHSVRTPHTIGESELHHTFNTIRKCEFPVEGHTVSVFPTCKSLTASKVSPFNNTRSCCPELTCLQVKITPENACYRNPIAVRTAAKNRFQVASVASARKWALASWATASTNSSNVSVVGQPASQRGTTAE